MSQQGWRIETDAQDYFGHQKKQLTLADRRPVIRKASDLVGPGLDYNATRLDDFNDLLGRYNGYYAATAGVRNAPVQWATTTGSALAAGAERNSISLAVRPPEAYPRGRKFRIGQGANAIIVTLRSAANTSSTSLSVEPFTPAADIPAGAPVVTNEDYVGEVIQDAEFGGRQVFVGMESREVYTRVFNRHPTDASYITWQPWLAASTDVRDTLLATTEGSVSWPVNTATAFAIPNLKAGGRAGTYTYDAAMNRVFVKRTGVYTGYLRVAAANFVTASNLTVEYPGGTITLAQVAMGSGVLVPLHFEARDTAGFIRVTGTQATSATTARWTHLSLTRVSDMTPSMDWIGL